MPPKRKKQFDREKDKTRNFELIVYPDSTTYDAAQLLDLLPAKFDKWAYILHDRDTDENGELKKAHYHVYGARSSPVQLRTIANSFDFPLNDVRPVFDWNAAIQYSCHVNDPDKYLYQPSDITSNFDHRKLFKNQRDDAEDAALIFAYIQDSHCVSMTKLTSWALDNGCWASFRRGQSIWRELLYENRQRIYARVDTEISLEAVRAANRVIFSEVNDNEPVPFEQVEF